MRYFLVQVPKVWRFFFLDWVVSPRCAFSFAHAFFFRVHEPTITMCHVMFWQRWVLLLLIRGLSEIPQGESPVFPPSWLEGWCWKFAGVPTTTASSWIISIKEWCYSSVFGLCVVTSGQYPQLYWCCTVCYDDIASLMGVHIQYSIGDLRVMVIVPHRNK